MNPPILARLRLRPLICALLATAPVVAQAGANNAAFRCVSTASRQATVTIAGNIPGDFASFELKVSAPSGELILDDATSTIEVIEDFKHGVFSLVVGGPEPGLVLYALPGTVKHKAGAGSLHASFAGVLVRAPKPGSKPGPTTYSAPALVNLPMELQLPLRDLDAPAPTTWR